MLSYTQRADFRRVIRQWMEDCKCPVSPQPEPCNYQVDAHDPECKFRRAMEAESQVEIGYV